MSYSPRCWMCDGTGRIFEGTSIPEDCWQCRGSGVYPNRGCECREYRRLCPGRGCTWHGPKPYCGTTNPEHKQAMERQRPAIIKRPWWDRLVRWLR